MRPTRDWNWLPLGGRQDLLTAWDRLSRRSSVCHWTRVRRSSSEHALDLAAGEADMHRAAVRAVGLKRRAVEVDQQRLDLGILEHPADPHRAVAGQLLKQGLEPLRAAPLSAAVPDTFDHIGEEA